MAGVTKRIAEALDAAGAKLKRDKRHRVYELPNGQNLTVAQTPSDKLRHEDNVLRDLRKATGAVAVHREGERRERRKKPGRYESASGQIGIPAETSPFAAALRQTGLIEQQLRTRIGQLEGDLERATAQLVAVEALAVVRAYRWLIALWPRSK